MSEPFWERSYAQEGNSKTFRSGQPSDDVVEVIGNYLARKRGRVLDLGCGDGRNALYAAERGMYVTAVDISVSGISKTKELADERGLKIEAVVEDMRKFGFEHPYDLIISHGCLHLIQRREWKRLLKKIRTNTTSGGLNVVAVFTDKIPLPEDTKPFTKGLFKEGELFDLYSDWEIISRRSRVFQDEHIGGIRHTHASNGVIARKPK